MSLSRFRSHRLQTSIGPCVEVIVRAHWGEVPVESIETAMAPKARSLASSLQRLRGFYQR